jgi:hypothetical protein
MNAYRTTQERRNGRNNPVAHSVLAVLQFFKGTSSRTGKPIPPGVFYSLALTFGTLLSSQGTEASFETVSPAPPGFPFVVPSLPDPFGPDSRWQDSHFHSSFSVSAFRRSRSPTLADAFRSDSPPSCPRAHVSAALVQGVVPRYWTPGAQANRGCRVRLLSPDSPPLGGSI